MSLETEVAALTNATTNLLNAVNVSKATLDEKVVTATNKAVETAAAKDIATSKASEAAGSAASALAIYGSAAAQQTAVDSAKAQASLAQGYAASASSVVQQDLSGITAQALHRSPNAVTAMFIYDTSKDSDGGAWTEKCQHTSWYNEPLAGKWLGAQASESAARAVSGATTGDYFQLTTDGKFYSLNATSGKTEVFRGNKAKFPKLAGIVAEASNVTIYDLTEPGRPMWRSMKKASSQVGWGGDWNATCVSAINGKLGLGISHPSYVGYGALVVMDLPIDRAIFYSQNLDVKSKSYKGAFGTVGFEGMVSVAIQALVNAVAMTVLPDAPVDPVTGLQVPTIAVATAGGVSVIKHNGTVSNYSQNLGTPTIAIDKNAVYVGSTGYINGYAYALNPGSLGSTFTMTAWQPQSNISNVYGVARASRPDLVSISETTRNILKYRINESSYTKSAAARITNTYNTGHLVGDIRRCYLSDNTVGSVTGPELVGDPSFDNPSAWVAGTNISVSGGNAIYSSPSHGVNLSNATQAFIAGKTYIVTLTCSAFTSGRITVYFNSTSGTSTLAAQKMVTGVGDFRAIVTVGTNGTGFVIQADSVTAGACSLTLSDFSIKEVVADRSYKAKGASITGTLTKSTVAPNAQLVAYSGFSAANYLQEPYSADLDFGTGEWSAGAWVNVPPKYSGNYVNAAGVAGFPTLLTVTNTIGTFSSQDFGGALGAFNDVTKTLSNTVAGTASYGPLFKMPISVSANKTYKVKVGFAGADVNKIFSVNLQSGSSSVDWGAAGRDTILGNGNVAEFIAHTFVGAVGWLCIWTDGRTTWSDLKITSVLIEEVGPSVIANREYSSGAGIKVGMLAYGYLQATAFDGTTTRTVTTTSAYNTGTWLKAEAVYKTDGSLAILVNGQEVAVTRGNPLLTLNNSNAVLTIGNSYALDAPFPGSIALLKLSATAPTYDQAQWMYEQEKQLFRDGAQCCLPDSGNIVDLTYDDVTDKWVAVSATNESSWTGLVRTNVTAVPAGSNSKVVATSGVKLNARTTTNPGVDVTIPAYLLREELLKDGEDSGKLSRIQVPLDYVGGFTATTVTGNTAITSVAGLSYPSQTTIIGATVTGSGIPASTTVVGISGTTIYLSKVATASASGVQISFTDFVLPLGMEAKEVISGGAIKTEGSTKDYTRLYDGFRETIRFGTAPGYTAAVQIIAIRSQS